MTRSSGRSLGVDHVGVEKSKHKPPIAGGFFVRKPSAFLTFGGMVT
jgi:hypothetical protein